MSNDNSAKVIMNVMVNGVRGEQFYADPPNDGLLNILIHMEFTLDLMAGDRVNIELTDGKFYTDPRTHVHFAGEMLF